MKSLRAHAKRGKEEEIRQIKQGSSARGAEWGYMRLQQNVAESRSWVVVVVVVVVVVLGAWCLVLPLLPLLTCWT